MHAKKIEAIVSKRIDYLNRLQSLSAHEDSIILMNHFIDTYKRYIDTFHEQYGVYHFVDALDQIERFSILDRWFWRMFMSAWRTLDDSQKSEIISTFPSLAGYEWMMASDKAERFELPFVPRAVTIAVASIITHKFDSDTVAKISDAYHSFVWVDYNFDLRDYERIYRSERGWGILEPCDWPYGGTEPKPEEFLRLLQLLVSFGLEDKIDLLNRFETFETDKLQRYIDDFNREIKAVFLMDMRFQNNAVAKGIVQKQREWEEILSYYGRSES